MVYFAYLDGRLGLAVEDLERGADAGLAEVPVLLVVVVAQQLHEPRHVHVVVVVEVTEPPATNTQRYNKLDNKTKHTQTASPPGIIGYL